MDPASTASTTTEGIGGGVIGGGVDEEDVVCALQQQLGGKYLQPPHELLTIQSRLQAENHDNHTLVAADLRKQQALQLHSTKGDVRSSRPGDGVDLSAEARDAASQFVTLLQQSPKLACRAGRHTSKYGRAEDVYHLAQVLVLRVHAWHSIDATMLLRVVAESCNMERDALVAASKSSIFHSRSWLRNVLQVFAQARPSSRKYADRIVQKPVQALYKTWKSLRARPQGQGAGLDDAMNMNDDPAVVARVGHQFLTHICAGVAAAAAAPSGDSDGGVAGVNPDFRRVPEELKCVVNALAQSLATGPDGAQLGLGVERNLGLQRVLLALLFQCYVFPAVARYARGLAAKLQRRRDAAAAAAAGGGGAANGNGNGTSAKAGPQAFPAFLLQQLVWLRTTLIDEERGDIRRPRPRAYPRVLTVLQTVLDQCDRRTVTHWPQEMTGYVTMSSVEVALLQQRCRETTAPRATARGGGGGGGKGGRSQCAPAPACGSDFSFTADLEGPNGGTSSRAVVGRLSTAPEVFHLSRGGGGGGGGGRGADGTDPADKRVPYATLFELIAAGDQHLKLARARLDPAGGAADGDDGDGDAAANAAGVAGQRASVGQSWNDAWQVVKSLRKYVSFSSCCLAC